MNRYALAWMVVAITVIFLSLGTTGYAGVLNKSESVIEVINNISPKVGSIYTGESKKWHITTQASLYDFEVKKSDEILRIGSLDIGYLGERKVYITPMISSKFFDVFSINSPFGKFSISAGPTIIKDFSEGLDNWSIEDFDWGVSTVGFTFKF